MSDLLQTGFAKYGDNTGNTFFCIFKILLFCINFTYFFLNGCIFRHTHLEESSICWKEEGFLLWCHREDGSSVKKKPVLDEWAWPASFCCRVIWPASLCCRVSLTSQLLLQSDLTSHQWLMTDLTGDQITSDWDILQKPVTLLKH